MVYFVGAGPGAPDLITVRGKNLLEQADVIIYAGSLVNPQLLAYTKDVCTIYNSAHMTLEQVLACIKEAEREQKLTVRLHTGDPSLYGAVHEQMEQLEQLGIDYEMVPGVSSFSAAAAALHAEYTVPGVSQSLILTRMEGRTPVPESEQVELLATHGTSMVFFLSAGMLEELALRLIAGGYDPKTPAAIVYKVSWPEETILRTTLEAMAREAAEAGIQKTALVLVGEFLDPKGERSKLYDPAFTHEFRKGTEQ